MTDGGPAAALSVVVVSFNTAALLERCLESLDRQTMRDGVEILVAEPWDIPQRPALCARFPFARWLRDPGARTVPQLRSLGIAHSRGAIIALLEDDCVVPEIWCAALLEAHTGAWAAVGGAVEPAGYATLLDWAVYFLEYVRFMQPLHPGVSTALPGTNVSYKRTALLPHLPVNGNLSSRVCAAAGFYEVFVHAALLRAGLAVKLDPALVVYNMHSWRVAAAVRSRFHHGRGFAAVRVARRPLAGRLPFLAIAAVLPAVQVARVAREVVVRQRHLGRLGASLPWIVVLAVSWSLGEFAGYLMGPGNSLGQWR